MAKLHRPYIPLAVRVKVAERQMRKRGLWYANQLADFALWPNGERLAAALKILFGDKKFALDHDPALCNRVKHTGKAGIWYTPAANDPNHLIYREAGPGSDHDIKTRVRGDGAQLSDLAIARKRKRKERAAANTWQTLSKRRLATVKKIVRKLPVYKPLKSASRWPPKGARKISNRRPARIRGI